MASSSASHSKPIIVQWLLDTRPLWPTTPTGKPKEEVAQLRTVASRALVLLTPAEQEAVFKYYFVKDAKMSLASCLLKHLAITKYCGVGWTQSTISREPNGKPYFSSPPGQPRMEFNVSHQAGLVTLIAAVGGEKTVNVGTDIVCVNERLGNDHRHIEKEGFFDWVDIHSEVFAPSELDHMKLSPLGLGVVLSGPRLRGYGNDAFARCQWRNQMLDVHVLEGNDSLPATVTVSSNAVIDAKLRRFYAMWCLREAFVKMTGDALLAPWLKELEISDVRGVIPKQETTDSSLQEGECLGGFPIRLKGKEVPDVQMELRAFGEHYMIGSALRCSAEESNVFLGSWKQLDLENDVLLIAEASP